MNYVYFIGSFDTDFDNHPAFVSWKKTMDEAKKNGDNAYFPDDIMSPVGYVFPDFNETRFGILAETSFRKIDHADAVVVLMKKDGHFDDLTVFETVYALHDTTSSVYIGDYEGKLTPIYDISMFPDNRIDVYSVKKWSDDEKSDE